MGDIDGKKILIVDDDVGIREAIETAISEMGDVEIITAGDGNTAVTTIEEEELDLLILDQMLPGRSGFLVMEKIKQLRQDTGKPPVIMITANPGARHKVYAQTLGVDVYINKPFRMDKLIQASKDLLSDD
jgi:DNA-binding response OmpR family regulator